MLRCVFSVVCAFAVAVPAVAEKRAFEIADYYDTAFVGAPTVSADGRLVAVSVNRYDLAAAESFSEIWLMKADGSELRQMTFGRHHDASPTFSPDGTTLLFSSDRGDAGSQLYVMALDGGEARRLTDFPLPLSAPVYSPDGRYIAATARVYPECGADVECNATLHEAVTAGPLNAYMADELLYRHWDQWRSGRFKHILLIDAATGKVVRDLTPGRWDSPPVSLASGAGYAFSPDGTELCFVSNRDPVPATSTNSDLWLLPFDPERTDADAVNITAGNLGWDGDPHYSPDGRSISFRRQQTAGYESDLLRLAVYDRRRGTVRELTDGDRFDNWVTAHRWSSDGSELLFQAEEEGRTPLYRIAARGGKPRHLHTDGTIVGWEIAGDALIYTRSRVGAPHEVFRLDRDGGDASRLSRFNAELEAEVDIRPVETLWVDGAGDYKVQVFVVKPHGFDPSESYPLILNVHGGPQQPWHDRYRGDWQVYPGKGYVVAFPNPTGSPGFGQDFVDAISCDWGGRVIDDVKRVADELADLPWVDSERMGAMGWSYGGYAMMWLEGHSERFKALASMMGIYDLRSMHGTTEELFFVEHDLCGRPWSSEDYRRWSPSEYVENYSTPCLVITGERDFRAPYTQSLQFFTDLQLREVPSRLIVLPDAGHWPSFYEMAFYYLAHLDWFHRWLGGGEPPWDVDRFLRNQVFTEGDILAASATPQ